MHTIEILSPSAPGIDQGSWEIGDPVGAASDRVDSDFLATLLAMAGHDLRQPLQRIASAHDVLAATHPAGRQRLELMQAEDATAQLARMLGQLVEALQLHERSCDSFESPVLVRPILEAVAAASDEAARGKGITLRVASTGGAALSHPLLLASILRNLIWNAIDNTPPGGCVFVSSHRRGPELCLYVRDTGIGIGRTALPAIFGAFHRGSESRADGLGLGLFIVKRAADLLGHRVEVRSVEGHGSVFTVKTLASTTGRRDRPEAAAI